MENGWGCPRVSAGRALQLGILGCVLALLASVDLRMTSASFVVFGFLLPAVRALGVVENLLLGVLGSDLPVTLVAPHARGHLHHLHHPPGASKVPGDTRGGALCVTCGLLRSDLRGLNASGIHLRGKRGVCGLLVKEPLRLLARSARDGGRDGG